MPKDTVQEWLTGSIVIDWKESLPKDADGVYLVNGVTVEQFKEFQDSHPELSSAEIIGALKLSGYDIVYIPISKSGNG